MTKVFVVAKAAPARNPEIDSSSVVADVVAVAVLRAALVAEITFVEAGVGSDVAEGEAEALAEERTKGAATMDLRNPNLDIVDEVGIVSSRHTTSPLSEVLDTCGRPK